jgi:hypothetical protein
MFQARGTAFFGTHIGFGLTTAQALAPNDFGPGSAQECGPTRASTSPPHFRNELLSQARNQCAGIVRDGPSATVRDEPPG